jgi:hypothetical protein
MRKGTQGHVTETGGWFCQDRICVGWLVLALTKQLLLLVTLSVMASVPNLIYTHSVLVVVVIEHHVTTTTTITYSFSSS